MAKINLLPWREEYRQEKKKEFISQMVGMCFLAALIGFCWVSMMDSNIESQNRRNNIMQTEISKLESQVKEIQKLKKDREEMVSRMQVIQDLQNTRPSIVHYFDEMVKALPNGVFLNSVNRSGAVVSMEGVAESNNRVSSFMRRLDSSEWFDEPNLQNVANSPENGADAVEFSMTLNMVLPADDIAEAEGADNG